MKVNKIIELISRGRTDYVVRLLDRSDFEELLHQGPVKLLQWLVYYNDTTALRLVFDAVGNPQ